MTATVTVRPFRWWDVAAVRRIEEDLFPEDPWSVEMFWSELADIPASRFYLVADMPASANGEAREAGEANEPGKPPHHTVAGYAGLMTQPAPTPGRTEGWVQNIAVAREYQGRGLGTVLLTALLDEAARRNCSEVWLEVRTDNDSAQRLYTRFGFESAGIRRGYYQPGNHDALIMRKALQ